MIFRETAHAALDNGLPYWLIVILSGSIATLCPALDSSAMMRGAHQPRREQSGRACFAERTRSEPRSEPGGVLNETTNLLGHPAEARVIAMAEVILRIEQTVRGRDGRGYAAQVCGRTVAGGMWEGWIEFEPESGGPPVRTPRETDQPNRADLEYWATGLEETYLEGALDRALRPRVPPPRARRSSGTPYYSEPAGPRAARRNAPPMRPVLDPFGVYLQGEDVLREELGALSDDRLRTIIRGYALANPAGPSPEQMGRAELLELIVTAARNRYAR